MPSFVTSCPVCDGRSWRPCFEASDVHYGAAPGRFLLARCQGCGLYAIQPPPSPEVLDAAYPTEYGPHHGRSKRRDAALSSFWSLVSPRPGMHVLDVGCGDGRYLERLHRLGCHAWGVEPTGRTPEAVRELGITVHDGTLEDAPFPPPRFDVISFVHVLEHLPDPVRTLRRAADLLAPGGRILMLTPNAGSLTFPCFREAWYSLDAPRHLHLFAPATLRQACRRAGLRVTAIQIHQRPKDILGSMRRSGRLTAAVAGTGAGRLAVRVASRVLADLLRSGDEIRLVAGTDACRTDVSAWAPRGSPPGAREGAAQSC
jgi:2-polyprenyl-3-methyl-5-hydroxy-6-metoxy-1,4-benzoquinol methylase